MKSISSRQNPWFKRIRAAAKEHDQDIVLEGPKQISDALARGWKPIAIVTNVAGGFNPPHEGATLTFSSELFDSLAETRSPQNVLALFPRPKTSARDVLSRRDSIAVALDGVQDPGNVGTIIRLAAAFDAAGVLLLPGCADPWAPKAVRASVGAVLTVPVATASVADLTASRRALLAADAAGAIIDPPARDAVLIFGSEGSGVSPEIRRVAKRIAVRTSGAVESLNVAASAAILLSRSFEARTT
jgi:TrmH family RNA methyltransferase